jgi:hypothetical protein
MSLLAEGEGPVYAASTGRAVATRQGELSLLDKMSLSLLDSGSLSLPINGDIIRPLSSGSAGIPACLVITLHERRPTCPFYQR